MSAAGLLRTVVTALDDAGIPHMLVGSFASMSHGAPRATQDIDMVIDPTPEALDRFAASFDPDRYYVSPSAQEVLTSRDQFNIIDFTTAWKVDLIIRKDRPFSLSEFARRVPARALDVDLYLATAEDIVQLGSVSISARRPTTRPGSSSSYRRQLLFRSARWRVQACKAGVVAKLGVRNAGPVGDAWLPRRPAVGGR